MCLVAFQYHKDAEYPLILVQNRDESIHRPSLPLHQWDSQPVIYAGKDQRKGGTWLAISEEGRFATLLNHPFTDIKGPDQPVSRGHLVKDFVLSDYSSQEYLELLRADRQTYEPFHLLFGDRDGLYTYSNGTDNLVQHLPGLNSVSNTAYDMSSMRRARAEIDLADYIKNHDDYLLDDLIKIFQNTQRPDLIHNYPDDLDAPTALAHSAVKIEGEDFGTVSTTALLVDRQGQVQMKEISYYQEGGPVETQVSFQLK